MSMVDIQKAKTGRAQILEDSNPDFDPVILDLVGFESRY